MKLRDVLDASDPGIYGMANHSLLQYSRIGALAGLLTFWFAVGLNGEELPSGAVRRLSADPEAGGVYHVSFSPNGKLLVTRRQDQKVRVWKVPSSPEAAPELLHVLSTEGRVKRVEFSPDSSQLLLAGEDAAEGVSLWDVATGKEVRKIQPAESGAIAAGFLTNGNVAIAATTEQGGWFDRATGEQARPFPACRRPVMVSPRGERIVEEVGNPIRLEVMFPFDPDAVQMMLPAGELGASAITFSDEERLAVAVRKDPAISLWRIYEFNGDAALDHQQLHGHTDQVQALAYSPDRRFLASASWDGTVRIWDLSSNTEAAVLKGHAGHVCAVAFSPDGSWLASGGADPDDNSVLIWSIRKTLLAPRYDEQETSAQADQLWWALGDEDARSAMQAVGSFIEYPSVAEELFREKLSHLVPKAPAAEIAKLITELDDDEFAVRQEATRQLMQLRPGVDFDLRKRLDTTQSAEMRTRLRSILSSSANYFDSSPSAQRRLLRAVLVLEWIAPKGADMLDRIAAAHPNPVIATAAKASLLRSGPKPEASPQRDGK